MYEGIISSNSITVSKDVGNNEDEKKEYINVINNSVEDRKEVFAEHCNEHTSEIERKLARTKKTSRKVQIEHFCIRFHISL